jgi:hypothetical protein
MKLKSYLDKKIQKINDGEESSLALFIELKDFLSVIEKAKKEIEQSALDEARRYDKQSLLGFKVEVRSCAGAWDFSGWSKHTKAKETLKALEEQAKVAAKLSLNGSNAVDDEGEVITPAVFKPGKETIFLTKTK